MSTTTVAGPPVRRRPSPTLIGLGLLIVWAAWRATTSRDVINTRGWSSFAEFWTAVLDPDLNADFLRLTGEAMLTTGAYAVLGAVASVGIGLIGAPLLAERPWEAATSSTVTRRTRSVVRWIVRAIFVVPRAVHEIIWALLLVQVFGFDPLVAVLAIAFQFGAITAKVYADLLDDADPEAFRALRAAGAGPLGSVIYGLAPIVRRDLIGYGFYRLECAVRSAAVLGIVGLGGLGNQLDLSFESLRYDEIWTLIAALMILSGIADRWSTAVRHSRSAPTVRASWIGLLVLVPVSWWYVGIDVTALWSERTRRLFGDLVDDMFPPRLGPGGWSELVSATVDTLAMSVLATVIAGAGGLLIATLAARPRRPDDTFVRRSTGWIARLVLLLFRAVPAPVWAFLVVLVMFPGIWPGAVALGVYNTGVLGRLFAEVFDDHDDRARRQLATAGAGRLEQLAYGVLPVCAPRLVSLSLYRWEVITRETVVVGVVGAAGLGRLIQEHLVARDFAAVTGTIGALVVLAVAIDALGNRLRPNSRRKPAGQVPQVT